LKLKSLAFLNQPDSFVRDKQGVVDNKGIAVHADKVVDVG
jgi:hypothetical protein